MNKYKDLYVMKPGVFTQLYIHLVFAVKHRDRLLKEEYRKEIFSYMSGIITNLNHKSIIINGIDDHVHILLGLNPAKTISDTVWEIKRSTSLFINEKKWFKNKFNWQDGYGGFSYSRSQIDKVYKYIQNQQQHHHRQTFKEEYTEFLKKFEIEYDQQFLFEFFD